MKYIIAEAMNLDDGDVRDLTAYAKIVNSKEEIEPTVMEMAREIVEGNYWGLDEDEIGTAIEDDLEAIRESRTENGIWRYETDDRTATWHVIPVE
jgi:hypothetical protein